MSHSTYIWLGIAMMALVTYLVRVLPILIFRKPITNQFIQSFLYYVPYAVLSAMTIPAVFFSGTSFPAVFVGVLAAGITAYFGQSLLVVACIAALSVFLAGLVL